MKRLIIIAALMLVVLVFPVTVGAQIPVECQEEYTVQVGDWLSKISEKYFGDPLAYPALLLLANAVAGDTYTDIANPDLIEPGWTLCIPSGDDVTNLLALSMGPSPASAPEGLAPADLANATYSSEFTQNGTAPLVNGEYSEPAAPGSATETKVRLMQTHTAYGEINGQPVAVTILVTDAGGSGTFYSMHVMVNQDGQPVNIASTSLGDRVQINSITVINNQIVVDMVQAGPDDPMCCPSQHVINTYEVQGDQLVELSSEVVESGGGGSVELTGTVWQWEQTVMNNDVTFVPDKPGNYTVEFKADGTVHLKADCNTANGTYTVDGSSITINEPLAMTRAMCPPGSLSEEFVKQLTGIAIYFFEGDNLYFDLKFDSGTMKFSPMKSVGLPGSAWAVRGYNNGKGGVVSVIIGTEMNATFGADGQIAGSSGCNNYSAGYKTDGNNIAIGPAIVTQMFCEQPEGVMDQEQQYLAALETAAVYTIEGGRLQLRTAEGSLAIDFVAAVTGQVTYLVRSALPDDAMMQVQLQDTSLADVPAKVVGEFVMPTQGRQVPLPFEVTYNPADIIPNHTYSLNVRITDGAGNLLFINTQAYNVLTQDNPTFGVEVVVDPV
jgi:heat shock protein HslJ/LysM repeat protein